MEPDDKALADSQRQSSAVKAYAKHLLERMPRDFTLYTLYPLLSRQAHHHYANIDMSRLLPHTVSIETHTLCNEKCSFCLAAAPTNPRGNLKMPDELFHQIIDELATVRYSGRVAFFVNNEPFIDKRIFDFVAYAKEKLPNAYLQISSNGRLIKPKTAQDIFAAGLSGLIINCYRDDGQVHPHIPEVLDSLKPEDRAKVTVFRRDVGQQITNRAGSSPNMETITKPMPAFCSFPFHQINVVHDGNVSLCCMDLLVQEVMGNVKDEGVLGVWFGEKFAEVRRKLLNYDRTCTDICKVCDWRGFKGLTGALEPLNRAMTHVA